MEQLAITKELIFSLEEYQERVAKVRREMSAQGIDTLLVHTFQNIFYLTGHQTFGLTNYHCLVVPLQGELFLVVRKLESDLARKSSWLEQFVTWGDLDDPVALTVTTLQQRGLGKGRIGMEEDSSYLTPRAAARIRAGIPDAHFLDAGGTVEKVRRIKSPREIEYIRETARMTGAGIRAAIEEIGEGKTENDVAAAAIAAMYRAGSEYLQRDPTVTSGPRSGIAHTMHKRRVLQRGDAVLLEMGACYNRYSGPLMRGVVIGKPADLLQRMAEACLEGLNAALAAMKPGATAGDVDEACRKGVEKHGFPFPKRTGYSIGVGFYPTWMEAHIIALKKDDPTVLEPGMAFHMPPALREPERFGVGFSETVVVTPTGCEVLTDVERKLFIK